MARVNERPRTGQTVWCLEYKNGIITGIDWESKLVYCDYYANGCHVHELDELLGYYDETLNQWIIPHINGD